MKEIEMAPESAGEIANVTKFGIFLVVQNIDRLWGKLFVRGIAIAETPDQAIQKTLDYLVKFYAGNGMGVVFERDQVQAFELGRLARRPEGVGTCQGHLKSSDVLTVLVVDTAGPAALLTRRVGSQLTIY